MIVQKLNIEEIDVSDLQPLGQAAQLWFPPGRSGKPLTLGAVHKYVSSGWRGVYLKAIEMPSGTMTTKAAALEFIQECAKHGGKKRRYVRCTKADDQQIDSELEARGL